MLLAVAALLLLMLSLCCCCCSLHLPRCFPCVLSWYSVVRNTITYVAAVSVCEKGVFLLRTVELLTEIGLVAWSGTPSLILQRRALATRAIIYYAGAAAAAEAAAAA